MVKIKNLFRYLNVYLWKRKLIKNQKKLYKELEKNNQLFI